MKSKVKTVSLIIAMVIAIGSGVYFANEINAQGTTYKIGDKGPAGGWIFYDKGNNSGGWRYLEAAPADQGTAAWGCFRESIPAARGIAIGTGKANTAAIIKSCGEAGIAARVVSAYRGGDKSDWFLPSKDELNLIYTNLYKAGVGGFSADCYWSSSELNADFAWGQFFASGDQLRGFKGNSHGLVRAIRAF